jgi:pyrimidine-nucleoside phosphorylase/thymidine phosphorylase
MSASPSAVGSAPELIRHKRDGGTHSTQELEALLGGYLRGDIADYQLAAWLMAVYFRGLSPEETGEWTRLMWQSGATFPRAHRRDFWIDKHSTGGVGDKTSLILVPWVHAVCRRLFGESVKIPMVSGRGLGHSGGTLDKLESVPGFSPDLPMERAVQLLAEQGFVMMGQTQDIAPADRRLYALRDVTATVECVPLIVSSILSKKLAENLDGLILDVKVGAGAFMKTPAEARRLADALIAVAASHGVKVTAVLTRMEEPLGLCVGNQLEVEECADFLSGERRDSGLDEVCTALAVQMVATASRGTLSPSAALEACRRELDTGEPQAIFRQMLEAQGGRWADFLRLRQDRPGLRVFEARAPRSGKLAAIDALAIGRLVHALGGGRSRKEDAIDYGVGVIFEKKCGDMVCGGDRIARVFYRRDDQVARIEHEWQAAVRVDPTASGGDRPSWILEVLHG